MKTLTISVFLIAATLALGACNTVEGFGRDMEEAGENIQNL